MYIYKYRNIGDIEKGILDKNLLSILENGEIYFSNPLSFNDPFDCLFSFDYQTNDNDLDYYLKQTNLDKGFIDKLILRHGKDHVINYMKDIIKKKRDHIYVYCLSSVFDNVLMWSHYAQNHYGVCVGFNTYKYNDILHMRFRSNQITISDEGYPKGYVNVAKVDYLQSPISPTNIFTFPSEIFYKTITTKSLDWNYENEYRLLLTKSAMLNNPLLIKKSEIKEIIFGLRTPGNFIADIITILASQSGIKYYKMEIMQNTYKLIRREIPV